MSLTATQSKVLNYIKHVHSDTDSMPSYGSIASAMGFKSNNAAVEAVQALIKKECLEPIHRGYRFKRHGRMITPWQRDGVPVSWMSNIATERMVEG